jgi:hypothetical protein
MNSIWATIRTSLVQKVTDIRKSKRRSSGPPQQQQIPQVQQQQQQQDPTSSSNEPHDLVAATANN